MKKVLLITGFIFSALLGFSQWNLQNPIGIKRCQAGSFTIGDTGFIVAGCNSTYLSDCWRYFPNGNSKNTSGAGGTWVKFNTAEFYPGTTPQGIVACAMDDTGYIGTGGTSGYNFSKTFYKYHYNTWTQIASLPGAVRGSAVCFTVLDTMYVGGGFNATGGGSYNSLKDFYKYDPTHGIWTRIADCPAAGVAWNAFAFSIGLKGYVGTGGKQTTPGGSPNFVPQNDFWQYDPTQNKWTQMANYPGGTRMGCVAWGTCDKGFAGTGVADASQTLYQTDFYEYDPNNGALGTWTKIANFAGSPSDGGNSFVIGKTAYVCGGQDNSGKYATLYSYNPPPLFKPSNATICIGSSISFTDTTDNFVPTNWQWTFSGATPATSTAQNPTPINYPNSGNYSVTLNAWNTCDSGSTTYTSYIAVKAEPSIVISPANPSICSAKSVTLTASGGTSYQWLSTSNTTNTISASALTDTTYNLAVSNGVCTKDTAIAVNVIALPSISITGTPTVCAGSSTVLTANGGSTYVWGDGSTNTTFTAAPASTGTQYSVTGTSGGCSATATATVTVNPLPTVTITGNTTVCAGSSSVLTGNGATSYVWSDASTNTTLTAAPASTGTEYSVTGTSNGCSASAAVTMTVTPLPNVTITGNTTVCPGASSVLTANGATSYVWNDASTNTTLTATPASTGTQYSVTGTANGCSASASVSMTVNPSPTIITTSSVSVCAGGSLPLEVTGLATGGAYAWTPDSMLSTASGPATQCKPTGTITYKIIGTDVNTCKDSTSVTVTVNPNPIATVTSNLSVCAGNAATLTATGGTDYAWAPATGLNSNTSSSPSASPANTTTYTVTVTDAASCSATATVQVTVNPDPDNAVTGATTITIGQSANLSTNNVGAGITYSWVPATGLSCTTCANPVATPSVTTNYTLTVTDSTGCSKEDSALVTVKQLCGPVYIPNAFSPNGDGNNDVLKVYGNCIHGIALTIFDRWGNVVYQSTNPDGIWDGTSKGKDLNTGTYIYTLTVTDADNNTINKKGNITLLR